MTSSILSMHKTLSVLCHQKVDISAYGAIGILLLGLGSFLWMGWQTMISPDTNIEQIILPRSNAPSPFPSSSLQEELIGLYGSTTPSSATGSQERFHIHGSGADDTLLLAAPRAKLRDSLVGVLISSNPAKSTAIIESGGKQVSYGISDRIAGKFTVLRILPDRVVINENGFYAALILAD
ncbi:type II secretion system protein N [Serratia sp. 2723]|uniref:type II secretion system protein N n=1 Tax=unclassified Serratia (in: enterobacteria) TaxID=2647522 RepID=UPI003D258042